MSQQRRLAIINIITTDVKYTRTCANVAKSYKDDVFQEVCEQVLTMKEDRLPTDEHLPFWFYCVARNVISKLGKLGRLTHREVIIDDIRAVDVPIEEYSHSDFDIAEECLIGLTEFENRVALLFVEHGDMKKVQRATGISYSALRQVKEKIKSLR